MLAVLKISEKFFGHPGGMMFEVSIQISEKNVVNLSSFVQLCIFGEVRYG